MALTYSFAYAHYFRDVFIMSQFVSMESTSGVSYDNFVKQTPEHRIPQGVTQVSFLPALPKFILGSDSIVSP